MLDRLVENEDAGAEAGRANLLRNPNAPRLLLGDDPNILCNLQFTSRNRDDKSKIEESK